MLRPNVVIEYAKDRNAAKLSDFDQLVNGVNVGGRIVIGGDEKVASKLRSVAQTQQRLAMILSIDAIKEPKLDPFITYSFDILSVAKLIMVAKNEAFHATIDQAISVIQDLVMEKGNKVEIALQILREQADTVGHL